MRDFLKAESYFIRRDIMFKGNFSSVPYSKSGTSNLDWR